LNQRPVFFDSKGRSARATNVILAVIAFAATSGLGIVGLGLVVAPSLPRLAAPPTESRQVIDAPSQMPSGLREIQVKPARARQIPERAVQAKRFAFFEDLDAGSLPSLKRNAAELDAIIPDWLEIAKIKDPRRKRRGIAVCRCSSMGLTPQAAGNVTQRDSTGKQS